MMNSATAPSMTPMAIPAVVSLERLFECSALFVADVDTGGPLLDRDAVELIVIVESVNVAMVDDCARDSVDDRCGSGVKLAS